MNFKPSVVLTEEYQAKYDNLISRLEVATETVDSFMHDLEDEFLAIDEDVLNTIDLFYKKIGSSIWRLNVQKFKIKEVHRSPNRLLSLRTDGPVSAPQQPQQQASTASQVPSGTDAPAWASWMPQGPVSDT